MRAHRWVLILILAAALGVTPPRLSLGNDPDAKGERVYFSALNKEEKPVPGLTAADFELLIDGRPAPLEGFKPGLSPTDRSIPLVFWILLSYGKTINSKVIKQQGQVVAGAFSMFHPASVMGIKLVSEMSETLVPIGHDPKALRAALLQYSERRAELRLGPESGTVGLDGGGMWRAVELALDEMNAYIAAQPALRDREVHRAVMILSAGDMKDQGRNYNPQALYAKAARAGAFLYPVVIPTQLFDQWVPDYYELAKKTAGVASVFGALKPGALSPPFPRLLYTPNALNVNFIHMARDLNGKYSFTIVPPPAGKEMHLELKCKVKRVQVRLARAVWP
jgi:hypothetical protein